MNKIGEQQLQRVFSEQLGYFIRKMIGENVSYACGDFNGMQDRKYSDYFAGVDSSNILIEFKEFFNEIKYEKRKGLRLKLCQSLLGELTNISYQCHHIAYRKNSDESIDLSFQRYISKVCPLFDIEYESFEEVGVFNFLNDFIKKRIGSDNNNFSTYLHHLASLAGDEGVEFYGVLISFDPQVGLKNTIFKNFSELLALISLDQTRLIFEHEEADEPENLGGGLSCDM